MMKSLKVVISVLAAVAGAALLGVFTFLGDMLLSDSALGGFEFLFPLLLIVLSVCLIVLKRRRKEDKIRKGEYVLLVVYVAVAAVFCRGFVHYFDMKGEVDDLIRMGKEDMELVLSDASDSVVQESANIRTSYENILESREILKYLDLSETLEDMAKIRYSSQNEASAIKLKSYISEFKGCSVFGWIMYIVLNLMVLIPYFLINEKKRQK